MDGTVQGWVHFISPLPLLSVQAAASTKALHHPKEALTSSDESPRTYSIDKGRANNCPLNCKWSAQLPDWPHCTPAGSGQGFFLQNTQDPNSWAITTHNLTQTDEPESHSTFSLCQLGVEVNSPKLEAGVENHKETCTTQS